MVKKDSGVSIFERQLQTGVSIVMVGLLGWAGLSLNELQKSAATMAVEIQHIKDRLQAVDIENNDIYTQTQATRDWAKNQQDLSELKRRIWKLEG